MSISVNRNMNGYTESGSYSVKGGSLALVSEQSGKRTIPGRGIAFGDGLYAPVLKADFSYSARIIGEFNVNGEGTLVITDREGTALSLETIRAGINNPYAYEILAAILRDGK